VLGAGSGRDQLAQAFDDLQQKGVARVDGVRFVEERQDPFVVGRAESGHPPKIRRTTYGLNGRAGEPCPRDRKRRIPMSGKRLLTTLMMLAAAASAAGLPAGASSGGAKAHQTIGLVLPDPNGGGILSTPVKSGGSAAASALGDDLLVIPADGPVAITTAVESLIARHVGAIVVNTDDALASQMKGRGQYAIVACRPAETIVQTWLKAVEAYVPRRYPRMKRVAVAYGDLGTATWTRTCLGASSSATRTCAG
jgi:hypothetical protein